MILTAQASLPEVKEDTIGESLIERSNRISSFQDLGPPDLINLIKQSVSSKTETGTFLYYTGVDTSNSASIAAHLKGIANLIGESPQNWFGKAKSWKVFRATYCSYNSFSKVDTRVTVHIPGKIESSIIDASGELVPETDKLWMETFITSIVRCLLSTDEDEEEVNPVVETRKINPFVNPDVTRNFLKGFEELFWEGSKLGSNVDVAFPTSINNYLVDAFLKCIEITHFYDEALEILERLFDSDPSVITIISKVLLLKDEEIKAVQMIHDGIKENNRDADLLILQAQFCLEKKNHEFALSAATQAVKSSPSEFRPWEILAKTYTAMGDYEQALLTLNSCPMNVHKDKYHLKRVVNVKPDRLHLPLPVDITLDDVSTLHAHDVAAEQKNINQNLLQLPAANLKSTFARGYDLLTEIVHKTGWESLLKYRAKVFVMEEEYRQDKSTSSLLGKNDKIDNAEKSNGFTNGVKETNGHGEQDASDFEFKNKRLCERWLDNLFMLLYEDLRIYTMWQAESVHFQAQQMDYKKSTLEWELLGSTAYRLKHYKEASVAFQNALSGRFSVRSTRKLLTYYLLEKKKLSRMQSSKERQSISPTQLTKAITQLDEKILESCVKLSVWNHRWYCEFSPAVLTALTDVIAEEGFTKIKSQIKAIYSSSVGVVEMMDDLFKFLEDPHIFGAET